MKHAPLWSLAIPLVCAAAAHARPEAPAVFCAAYPDASTCASTSVQCLVCHTSTSPQPSTAWNEYGTAVLLALGPGEYDAALTAALQSVEGDDSDGDGLSNLEEILIGTLPGDPLSHFQTPAPGVGDANPVYRVDEWDAGFALKRALVAFCGRSPSYDEMQALAAAADARAHVHAKLDECLQSAFWTDEGLSRLADERVRPISFGTAWEWDYRLWRYVLTGDRDVRDLLLAQYHVRERTPGALEQINDVVNDGNACTLQTQDTACAFDSRCGCDPGGSNNCTGTCEYRGGRQPLVQAERAGMLGMSWFHFINTMFSGLPRTTAAQAMRGYLGMDIARQQGIRPVVGEPIDVDAKGVQQQECAQCHATLDPAAYVFAKYRGIEGGGAASEFAPGRPITRGLWTATTEPDGILFGQVVHTLREWAAVAVDSDAFFVNLSRIFFEHAIGRAPGPQDKDDFDALWPRWRTSPVNYNASAWLHELVDTNAFGAP